MRKGSGGGRPQNAGSGEQIVVSGQWETLNGEAGVQERTFSWCQTSVRGGSGADESLGGPGFYEMCPGSRCDGRWGRQGCWGGVCEPAGSAWVTRRTVSQAGKVGPSPRGPGCVHQPLRDPQ